MTDREKVLCNGIIHTASLAAGAVGAGLAQVPGSDNLLLAPLQTAMAISLGEVFGISLTTSTAQAACANATAFMVGRGISQMLVGWIPVAGNIVNAGTAASITEAMGWFMAREFEQMAKGETAVW